MKKQSLAQEATVLTAAKVSVQVFMLISVMILTRLWSLEEYGTYSQMQIVVNLLVSVVMLGFPNSINYFIVNSESNIERNNFLSTYYTSSTVLGIVTGIIVVACIPLIEKYFNNYVISNYYIFLVCIPLTKITMNSIEHVLIVYKKARATAVFSLLHGIAIVSASLVAVWGPLSFSQYLILYLAIECGFCLAIFFLVNHLDGRLKIRIDFALLKKILRFSIPLGLAGTAGTLHVETDKLIIGYFFNTEQLAVYTNAAKELPFKIVAAALAAAIMPYLARFFKQGKPEEAIALWKSVTTLSLIIHVFLSIGLAVFSVEAVTFLYSDKYISGSIIFAIYSLIYIVRATSFGSLLAAMGNTKAVLYTELILLAANTVLNVVFFYLFGFVGPAIATVFVATAGMVVILKYASNYTHISMKNIYPWIDLAVIVGVNAVLGVVFYVLKGFLPLEQYISGSGEAFLLAACWAGIIAVIFRKKIKANWLIMKQIS